LIFSWNNCFDKWKTIYTKIYNEFFDPTGWINDNINDYQYLITDTFAVGVLDEKKITDSLLKSLFHRIPIYIGANNSDLKNKVKEAEKECFLENRNGALSVIGTVAVFEQDGKKYKGKAISSHMFGLNFEGKDSADSKEYVESEKIKEGLKKQLEDDLYRRYYASMCATALYMEKHSIKKVKKCFPLIGLGCYLSVLCSVSKQYVRTATFQAIQKAHKRINEEIKDRGGEISILMFGFSSCDKKSLEDAKFEENQIDQTGNIFDFPAIEDEKCRTNKNGYIVDGEEVIELVNAWDDLSFIGNAQSNDCSIDGWYVTALDNYNTYFKNTSFLFNCFLTNRHLAKDKVYFVDEKKGFSCLYTCSSKDVETVFQGREAFFENDYMEQLEQVETTLFEVEAK
jgi:hypothetical protein